VSTATVPMKPPSYGGMPRSLQLHAPNHVPLLSYTLYLVRTDSRKVNTNAYERAYQVASAIDRGRRLGWILPHSRSRQNYLH